MTIGEVLQFTNVLLVPALVYITRLETRIVRLETVIKHLTEIIMKGKA